MRLFVYGEVARHNGTLRWLAVSYFSYLDDYQWIQIQSGCVPGRCDNSATDRVMKSQMLVPTNAAQNRLGIKQYQFYPVDIDSQDQNLKCQVKPSCDPSFLTPPEQRRLTP